jgi:apolipoprotein N-acyltransferase
LNGAREFVAGAGGVARAGIALAAGAASVLAMAPFFAWPVLFLTLPVLVWLIDGSARLSLGATQAQKGEGEFHKGEGDCAPRGRRFRPALRAAAVGWWFGFGYFLAGLFWIGEAFLVEAERFAWLLPVAVTLMPAGLALFYAAAAGLARMAWRPGLSRILVLAVALACAEWLRGHVLTGFPWNVLGYALTYPLPLMQGAGLVGIYGLTLVAVVVFAAPLVLTADASRSRAATGIALAVVPLLALSGYGAVRLAADPAPMHDGVRLRIVQPSVPQREKWRPEKQREIFLDHLSLSRHDAHGNRDDLAGVTHLVWPEAAMPFVPLKSPEALEAIAGLVGREIYLLSGALRIDEPDPSTDARRRVFNSLLVFGPQGALAALYDKIHLVPFGEFLPFQASLEAIGLEQLTRLRGGFASGAVPRPLVSLAGLPPIGALICYEAIFPGEVVQGSERPGVLLNLTNDGWFGDTTGPQQHFHQARVRAVEQGVPLVRAANNGVSAVIDAEGRVLGRLALNARGVIDSPLPQARPATLYARFGDGFFGLMLLIALALAWRVAPKGPAVTHTSG